MPLNPQRVASLVEEIQSLTEEISAKERRLASALGELNRTLGHQAGRQQEVLGHVLPRGVEGANDIPHTKAVAGPWAGEPLTERIVEFLTSRGGRSFLPRQIAEALNVPDSRKKTLNTTLYQLGRQGRIRKTEVGWSGPLAMKALAMGCALVMMACSLVACSGSSSTTSSTSGTTSGPGTTSASTTGRHTTTTSGVSTGSYTSTGATSTGTSGSTTSGSTGGSSTGTGTTGTTTGTTTSSGTTTGTTGYPSGPPYEGFDSGMRLQPPVDQGCTPAAPFRNQNGYCVGCRTKSDCPTGLQCDSTNQCVICRSATDCPMGQICSRTCENLNVEPYYACQVSCTLDCRTPAAGPDFCKPGACDGDAGGCMPNECYTNSDCRVNGLGACDFSDFQYQGYGNCVPCTTDAGGCAPDSLCTYDNNTGRNVCQLSCIFDAGVCGPGTYCTDAGTCTAGCQSAADCTGSSGGSICSQGQCVGCLTNANCPDWNAGCNPQYQNGTPTCGYCTSDQDCLGGGGTQHCETNKSGNYYGNQCACHADSDCPFDAPVCVGLDATQGFPQGSGRCACTDSSQCPSTEGVQFICETRYPYSVMNGSYGSQLGGACIAPCNVDLSGSNLVGTDCSTAGIGGPAPNTYYQYGPPPGANICNNSTGYCVTCAQDSDCYAPASPVVTPSCVAYANGIDPGSGEPTGGGLCGCDSTTECNDGWACWDPGLSGYCAAPCTYVNGVDSCNPYRGNMYDQPPTDAYCDTFTGGCVQCLDSYGCTNVVVTNINGKYIYPGFAAPNCSPTGQCVGCSSDSDCPASAPNCTNGFCGYCTSNSQCYQDAGFSCLFFNGTGNGGTCTLTGCVGDSNELATDAGTLCPPSLPYCPETEICSNQCTFPTICAECRPEGPPNYEYYGDCNNYPPGAYYGYCENNGKCQYYYN